MSERYVTERTANRIKLNGSCVKIIYLFRVVEFYFQICFNNVLDSYSAFEDYFIERVQSASKRKIV